jgi:hypothetical protein
MKRVLICPRDQISCLGFPSESLKTFRTTGQYEKRNRLLNRIMAQQSPLSEWMISSKENVCFKTLLQ